ncbi:hypothetical protein HNY73_019079 [Argiope bruennichi]|uniref:DUF19 domain-containing protein n=1 Tax=Argiope bruennichi TaxID=94029 RepID=A0A8T0EFQ7_ARGBR|nr:hypothetical protein HNY73_019079 [Argiope bruennichi]
MKILFLLAFGVLFESAWCAYTCFSNEFSRCASSNFNDIAKIYNSCDSLKEQAKCVYSAALSCNTGFIPEAYKYINVLNYTCKKNDNYYERFRHCFGNAVNGSNCQKPYREIMKNKGTPSEILVGLKEACKKIDWFGRCLQGNTEDFCGGIKSDYFYDTVLENVLKLNKLLCTEVILPAEDNLHQLTIWGIPRFIESVVGILTAP